MIDKERATRVAFMGFLLITSVIGLSIHNYASFYLAILYHAEVVLAGLTCLFEFYNNSFKITDEQEEERHHEEHQHITKRQIQGSQHLQKQQLEDLPLTQTQQLEEYLHGRERVIIHSFEEHQHLQEQPLEEHEQDSMTRLKTKKNIGDKIVILHFNEPGAFQGRQIRLLSSVVNVRGYILCCIIRNIDLAAPDNLNKLLNLQNQIHGGFCQRKTLATIGIHDLSSISGNLVYDAPDPNEIQLIPFGKDLESVSARKFYDQMWRDAELERAARSNNQFSDVYQYLTLLQHQNQFPCLSDEKGYVLSVPPLIDAERTKLSNTTESVLIEITSNRSLAVCHDIMYHFLCKILELELGLKTNNSDDVRQILILQQVMIVNNEEQMISIYPLEADLDQDKKR